jgi:hypothetical protein
MTPYLVRTRAVKNWSKVLVHVTFNLAVSLHCCLQEYYGIRIYRVRS